MRTASELNGILGMMPAFATPDAVDIRSTQTVAVDNLKEGVDKIIKDGINNIATTGTYGECYNLLFDEFKTLAVATVETVKKRVPLFIGVTSPNPREVIQKMNFVKETDRKSTRLNSSHSQISYAVFCLKKKKKKMKHVDQTQKPVYRIFDNDSKSPNNGNSISI